MNNEQSKLNTFSLYILTNEYITDIFYKNFTKSVYWL